MSKDAKELLATKVPMETYTDETLNKIVEEENYETFAKLKAEVEPYKNTLVLDGFDEVARLIDVIDGEWDFYYVVENNKRGIIHHSCVGTFIPLKGFIEQEKYDRLVHVWNLNHVEKAI